MTQLINYDNSRRVMVYHTRPAAEGTDEFEHKEMVPLTLAVAAKRIGGSDDPDTLVVECPAMMTPMGPDKRTPDWGRPKVRCGAVVTVPICGDAEAQEFHARVHHARGEFKTVEEARDYVVARVKQLGHEPRIDRNGPKGRP